MDSLVASKPNEKIQALLKEVVTHFDNDDRTVRERQIRKWRQLKLFWEGFQKVWYSEVAHDWRVWDEESEDDTGQSYYDKPVNIFRAYLESIIAALSVTVPPVKAYPDDADSVLDLETAKGGDKIAALIYRHNDAPLLWLHALFVFCTEGMTACYSYPKSDDSYGTYDKHEYEDYEENHQMATCPNCQYNLQDNVTNPIDGIIEQYEDKFQPDDKDVPILDYADSDEEMCPACQAKIVPLISQQTLIVTRLVGTTREPKTRICMEVYGGLNVKVPSWARTQKDCPYLIFAYETHYANAIEEYAEVDAELLRKKLKDGSGPRDPYEEWARLSPQYNGEYPRDLVTVRTAWLRPAAFNILSEEDEKLLRKHYPSGAKVVLLNDEFAEACNEALDDCWTLTYNPMSDYIHFDPLGLLLVSLQEMINDLISLIMQTIEHGIGQTFADPGVLNFDAYRQLEATPGGVYEAKPKSGQKLGDGFYEMKTATLSGEVLPFFQTLQSLSQLVSGALPSLFGGQVEGSGTASEYSMSRAQALQRLQNSWKMLTSWWKNIFGKAIPMFIEEMQTDERQVERQKDGSFLNIFIRKAEMEGKIGRVELEANENLPMTWNQKKDVIMQLVNLNSPEILAILGSPENLPVIREAIGLDDFFVPGEDDRDKQLDEIKQLTNSEPMPDPMTGQELPSVEIDPDNDNHTVQYEICRNWIIGEAGRQAKVDNPDGYRNVLLHAKAHKMMEQMNMLPQGANGSPNPAKPNEPTGGQPINGEGNVSTEA